jgi:N-acetyl-gamma-glutamyl-phosphate reductase
MKKIGVVADIGYTSVELRRILATHPEAELAVITSRNEAGTQVPDLYPSLPRRVTISFSDPAAAELRKCEVVFFARPNGVAMAETPALLKAGVRVVDLAADFRIKDIAEWEKSYG